MRDAGVKEVRVVGSMHIIPHIVVESLQTTNKPNFRSLSLRLRHKIVC